MLFRDFLNCFQFAFAYTRGRAKRVQKRYVWTGEFWKTGFFCFQTGTDKCGQSLRWPALHPGISFPYTADFRENFKASQNDTEVSPCSCMSIEFWEREDLGTNVRINFSSDAVVGLYLWLDRCTSFILNETFLSSTLSLVCLLDLVVKAANNRKHKAVTSTKFKPYICIKGGLSVPYNWCASQGSIIFFPGPILPFSVSWTVYCSHISNILFSLRKKQAAGSVCSRKRLADFSETEPAHWLPSH